MLIFNKIAGFPWKTSDTVRKVVSKSQGIEKFDTYKDAFLKGCAKRGIDEETAEKMFVTMRDFGAYGFNLSHAVGYSMIAYWCMWMKVHYPLEYLTTLLSNETDTVRVGLCLKEAGRLGIEIRGPKVGKSGWLYQIEDKAIRIGFKDIKGVGEKAGRAIEALGPIKTWKDFMTRIEKHTVNARVLKALLQAGACSDLKPHISLRAVRGNDWEHFEDLRQLRSGPWMSTAEYSNQELAGLRHEVFPIHVGPHPLTTFSDVFQKYKDIIPIEAMKWKNGIHHFAGVITNVGYSTVHRMVDGQNKPKKLTYCTLDGEREYMVMMVRGGIGEPERVALIKVLNGKPVVVKAEIDEQRNKAYMIDAKPLALIQKALPAQVLRWIAGKEE